MKVDQHLCDTGVIVLPPQCGHRECPEQTAYPLVIEGVALTRQDLN